MSIALALIARRNRIAAGQSPEVRDRILGRRPVALSPRTEIEPVAPRPADVRRRDYTPEQKASLVTVIAMQLADGWTQRAVAQGLGIPPSTVAKWVREHPHLFRSLRPASAVASVDSPQPSAKTAVGSTPSVSKAGSGCEAGAGQGAIHASAAPAAPINTVSSSVHASAAHNTDGDRRDVPCPRSRIRR